MASALAGFEQVVVLGPVPEWLEAALNVRIARVVSADTPGDDRTWVSVEDVLADVACGDGHRTLVATARPLYARGTEALFGFADARRRVAIVSIARLVDGRDPGRSLRRVENVVAHEAGHLDHLRHCTTPGCLMNSVRTLDGLDRRGQVPCGRCPRTGVVHRAAAAIAFAVACAAVFAVLDRVAIGLKPGPTLPFSCATAGAGAAAYLRFNGAPVETGTGAERSFVTCRTADEAEMLNRAFQTLDPPLIEGVPAAVQDLLQAKGLAGERCPDCHIARRADTLAAARFMKGIRP